MVGYFVEHSFSGVLGKDAKLVSEKKRIEIANVLAKYIFNRFAHKEDLEKYLVCREDFFFKMADLGMFN